MCQKFSTTANLILKPYSKLQNLRTYNSSFKTTENWGFQMGATISKYWLNQFSLLVLSWYCPSLCFIDSVYPYDTASSCLVSSWYCLTYLVSSWYFLAFLCLDTVSTFFLVYVSPCLIPFPDFFNTVEYFEILSDSLIVGTMENSYWLTGAYFVEVKFWLKARS